MNGRLFLADLVVLLHLTFVLFAVLGGALVLRWKRAAWFHLPTVFWAALVEFTGWICPLTPLENRLRETGGGGGYQGDFIAQYLVPVLYPAGLTRSRQLVLGLVVLGINAGIYGWILLRPPTRP